MKESDLADLLHRYQLGQCTPEENRAVEQWYDALGQDRLVELPPSAQARLQERLWQGIAGQTGLAVPVPTAAPAWWGGRWRLAAAAVLLAGSVAGAFWLRPAVPATAVVRPGAPAVAASAWVVHPNRTTQPQRIALPDGSVVTLAPASSLRYPRRFRGERRQVYLQGEAFFAVYHNPARPFQVYTDKVITTVLGTSFRVRAFAGPQAAQVQVRTGRVRVTPIPGRQPGTVAAAALPASVVLTPNQQAEYAPATHALKTGLVAQPVLLTEQPLVFDDRPVAEVFAALEKAYGVPIVYDHAALAHCTISLILQQKTLAGKLDLLCKTLGGSYRQVGTQLVVQAQGCPKD